MIIFGLFIDEQILRMRQKRKSHPVHFNKEKRNCLTWSMNDLAADNVNDIIDEQIKYSESNVSEDQQNPTTSNDIASPVNHKTFVYEQFLSEIKSCSMYLKICFLDNHIEHKYEL